MAVFYPLGVAPIACAGVLLRCALCDGALCIVRCALEMKRRGNMAVNVAQCRMPVLTSGQSARYNRGIMAASTFLPTKPNGARPKSPWERQDGENSKAYEAFCLYRDLGSERTFMAVANEITPSIVEANKGRYNWHARAIAYDDYLDEQKRKKLERQRLDMAERQARIGQKMQDVALTALETGTVLPESVQDVARLVDVGVKVERLACGESTENVQEKQIQIIWSGSQPKWAPKVDGDSDGAVSTVGTQRELPDSVGAGIPPASGRPPQSQSSPSPSPLEEVEDALSDA